MVLDVRLPPGFTDEGLRAAAHLRDTYPTLGILMLSTYAEPRLVIRLLDTVPTGVGYLLKDRVDDVDELVTALRRVSTGGVAVDGQVVADLLRGRRRDGPVDRLSAREREVLASLAEGRSNAGIANSLHLSVKTVETHIASIFRALDLAAEDESNRRVRAALAYLAHVTDPATDSAPASARLDAESSDSTHWFAPGLVHPCVKSGWPAGRGCGQRSSRLRRAGVSAGRGGA